MATLTNILFLGDKEYHGVKIKIKRDGNEITTESGP